MSEPANTSPTTLKLSFHEKAPPVAIIAISKLTGTSIQEYCDPKFTPATLPILHLPEKEQLVGKVAIVRYIVRSARGSLLSRADLTGYGVLSTVQVDHWLEYSNLLVNGLALEATCARVNDFLALRMYLADHQPTAADIVCWAQLAGSLQWEGLKKAGKMAHLSRWYDHMSNIPELQQLAEKYYPKRNNAAKKRVADSIKESKSNKDGPATRHTDASFDIGLGPEWTGRVVTRFPPEPSGFLHVGHAKALILNQEIAAANKGRMLVRFDDTNPDKEKDVYVESILADCEKLGAEIDKVTYTSNYFPQLLDLAERLIKAGHLYADDTPQEMMKEERMAKQPSQKRGRSVEENLKLFKEMQGATEVGLKNCLRFKLDYANDNGTLRDPVAFRCNLTPHLHTGTQYKAYPTYDFACPFVDAYEKVTHALRSSEYKDREEQFYKILKLQQEVWPELPHVAVWDYSRLSFINTVLSKRKLTKLVNAGIVESWDDPRMPTVQGLLRRGLTVPAMREFMLAQGASRNVTYQEWDKLWTFNKKVIDPVCPRHTGVVIHARVLLKLTDVEGPDYVSLDRHKKYPAAGKKTTMRSGEVWLDQEDAALLKEGEEVTLMDWGNAIIKVIKKEGGEVSGLEGVTHLEGSVKSTKWKLTWLAKSEELIPLTLVDFDHLLSKKKLEEDDEILDVINPCSRWETAAEGDSNMRLLQKGDILQLERKGYYIVDEAYLRPGKAMVLFNIPDGRQTPLKKPTPSVQASTAGNGVQADAVVASTGKQNGVQERGKVAGKGKVDKKARKEASEPAVAATKVSAATSDSPMESSKQHLDARDESLVQSRTPTASNHPDSASRPIPVPNRTSPEGSSGSVPPTPANTPANTPQGSMQLPSMSRGLSELSGGSILPAHLSSGDGFGSSVPSTPNNTPQRSSDLPTMVRERLLQTAPKS